MGEVNLMINGRNFGVACDDGQEQRVLDLGHFVDQKLKTISKAGAATNELHLLVLTTILLADEIHDLRESLDMMAEKTGETESIKRDELMIAQTIHHLADRIDVIAQRIQKA